MLKLFNMNHTSVCSLSDECGSLLPGLVDTLISDSSITLK